MGLSGIFTTYLKWLKGDKGATAVEFAIVAIPFTFTIIAIIEVALMYTTAALLEGGTGAASRMIRTCQIQGFSDPEAEFRKALCGHAVTIPNCERDVFVEAVAMEDNSFMSVSDYEDLDYDEDGELVSHGFSPGSVSDVIFLRTAYRYSLMTPMLGQMIGGPDGKMLFVSTAVLQVEPCEFEGGT